MGCAGRALHCGLLLPGQPSVPISYSLLFEGKHVSDGRKEANKGGEHLNPGQYFVAVNGKLLWPQHIYSLLICLLNISSSLSCLAGYIVNQTLRDSSGVNFSLCWP